MVDSKTLLSPREKTGMGFTDCKKAKELGGTAAIVSMGRIELGTE